MDKQSVDPKVRAKLDLFGESLQQIYGNELISITVFGSAAREGAIAPNSKIDVAVILTDTSIPTLARSSKMTASTFNMLSVIYFTEEYVRRSLDTFPIEFLDIKENHIAWIGKDIFKDIVVGTTHLRFQCEHEIKAKVIFLKKAYLNTADKRKLAEPLVKSCTSMVHLMRSIMRLKNTSIPQGTEDLLREVAAQFGIDVAVYQNILNIKKTGQLRINPKEIDALFCDFVTQTEKLSTAIDVS